MFTLEGREPKLDGLRRQLDLRQARRYRRRRLRRWRRRRLMASLMVAEREAAEAPTDALAALHDHDRRRLQDRLARNARRLYR
jgi:hypothetical protein